MALLGKPCCGKSTLLNAMTKAGTAAAMSEPADVSESLLYACVCHTSHAPAHSLKRRCRPYKGTLNSPEGGGPLWDPLGYLREVERTR